MQGEIIEIDKELNSSPEEVIWMFTFLKYISEEAYNDAIVV